MRILFPNSNTSSNIGNAFFYEGVRHALKKVLPEARLIPAPVAPYTPYTLRGERQNNALNLTNFLEPDFDAVLLAGPVMDRRFEQNFGGLLRRAKAAGKPIILLSIGGIHYSDSEIAHCRKILQELQPDILLTRGAKAHAAYGDLSNNSYAGICFAFFCKDYHEGFNPSGLSPYISLCFDYRAEPKFDPNHLNVGDSLQAEHMAINNKFGKLAYFFDKTSTNKIGRYNIVRLHHKPTKPAGQIFKRTNMVSDFNVGTYLSIYKNTELTLSDRLHSVVVTLAFGKPAGMLLRSERSEVLDRVNARHVIGKIGMLDLALINDEQTRMLSWLGDALHSLAIKA